MKQKVLSFSLFVFALFTQQYGYAYDFEVDGIYYNVISFEQMTAGVTHDDHYTPPTSHYSGNVSIPSSVTYNGKTFSVISILKQAFTKSTVTSVNLPNSILEICESAFSGCKNLVSVNIPNSTETIGSYCFSGCSELTSVEVPNSVSVIGSYAFQNCIKLVSIQLSNQIKELSPYLFSHCEKLSSLVVPSSVTDIRQYAFDWCNFESLFLPKSVINFEKFYSLEVKTFILEDGENEITFTNGWTICPDSLYLGRTIKDNGYEVFSPKKLEVGKNVSKINLIVPSQIVSIRHHSTTPPIWNTKFYGTSYSFSNSQYMDVIISVPREAKSAYESAEIWKNFWNIQEYSDDGTGIETKKCEKPSISYTNGKLIFTSETEGATCYSSITDADIRTYIGNEIQLGVSYIINVYATKPGYENSDVVTATLCWIDKEPETEGIDNNIAQVRANAVLIQTRDGQISVSGVDDGTRISAYGVNGLQLGSVTSHNGHANIITHLLSGNIAIIKIGDRSVKVTVK